MIREKILVVDDEKSIRKTVHLALEDEGYLVQTAETGSEALKLIDSNNFNVIILDLRLTDKNGMEILQHVIHEGLDAIVIMITAHGTIDAAVEAVKSGAHHFVTKPIDLDYLKQIIREAMDNKKIKNENILLKEAIGNKGSFFGIVYQSKEMQEITELIKLAAKTDNNVLIIGPTGTGKELIADAVHLNSRRKNNFYMKMNCAVLSETLLESELFGHEKGAFTDAKNQKKGIFEMSDRGTILFDEIGCMSYRTQSKMLRVLEDKMVCRLGGEKSFKVDVRIIASTNEDLQEAIKKEVFRSDLYYRLNVVKIQIPALRDRKEDIPPLINHFINKHAGVEKRERIKVATDAMEMLLEYDWPGNIRELENVIQRALIFDIDREIGIGHLPQDIRQKDAKIIINIPSEGVTYKDFTTELVKQTVVKTDGNKTKAADILGVSREFIRRHAPKESYDS